jgi:hypothetical protein
MLYPGVEMDADSFMTKLETGELLVKVRISCHVFRPQFDPLFWLVNFGKLPT